MRKQPDFGKVFRDYFGCVPRKITYEVRMDANLPHDLAFLSSLIHDARFKMTDVNLRGKRLTININRDCWELGMDRPDGALELYIADSRLSISKVLSLDWMFDGRPPVDNSTELWIRDISYTSDMIDSVTHSVISSFAMQCPDLEDRGFECPRRLALNGHFWSSHITLLDDRIKLADKETPYLYSQGKKKPTKR